MLYTALPSAFAFRAALHKAGYSVIAEVSLVMRSHETL